MLWKQELSTIQEIIDYKFRNEGLLRQAFVRKSYAQEHGGNHNEVLEFYGDKALEFVVMRQLSEYYGHCWSDGEYESAMTEGELTEIKKKLICKKNLASRVKEMGLEQYLLMGKGDIRKQVQNEPSVLEDLFEAIVGAIAIDSHWDPVKLGQAVERMLSIEVYLEHGLKNEANYVDLVQRWCQKKYDILPAYSFGESEGMISCTLSFGEAFEKMARYRALPFVYPKNGCQENSSLQLFYNRYVFYGRSWSKSMARSNAAKEAYQYLQKHDLLVTLVDEVGEPRWERAINQLQELYQKDYIPKPDYQIYQDPVQSTIHSQAVWKCVCALGIEWISGSGYGSSQKEAKKEAAYKALRTVMDKEDEVLSLYK